MNMYRYNQFLEAKTLDLKKKQDSLDKRRKTMEFKRLDKLYADRRKEQEIIGKKNRLNNNYNRCEGTTKIFDEVSTIEYSIEHLIQLLNDTTGKELFKYKFGGYDYRLQQTYCKDSLSKSEIPNNNNIREHCIGYSIHIDFRDRVSDKSRKDFISDVKDVFNRIVSTLEDEGYIIEPKITTERAEINVNTSI